MKNLRTLLLILSIAFVSQAISSQNFKDAWGRDIQITILPRRIISLNPSVTEYIYALGAEEHLIAISEFCDYPAQTKQKVKVGGFSGKTVNLEQIVSLEPDLVLLSADMHAVIAHLLGEYGIRYFAFEPRNLTDIFSMIHILGSFTNTESKAESICLYMEEKINNLKQKNTQTPKKAFFLLWPQPIMTAGGGTIISYIMELAGFQNIFADRMEQWPSVNVEEILIRQAQYIISDDSEYTKRILLSSDSVFSLLPEELRAHHITLPADWIYRYGPRMFQAVELLARSYQ